MMKFGIMGGTFNPIHFGHLFLAENAYEQIGLDQILFMPSKNPPHKAKPTQVTDQQRVEMIALAIRDNPHFALSTVELERSGYTYTADTLTLLKKENPETEYYFIVGADSLFMMHQWYQPQTIFSLCTVVAAGRDNVDFEKLKQQAEFLQQQYQARILLLDMPTIQIASGEIRKRIIEQKSVRYYLPEVVSEYINKNRLYLTASED
jgi:nicotinate-nucleotide adenylyltransferase